MATKVKALQNVNISPGGKSMRMVAGETYEIDASADEIDDYVRGKYVSLVKPTRTKPAAKQANK